ncbi:hypothetical protein [Pedobacter duraquae]|uniref:hypothetical protein n=1 Tax=Pedobacter duraquae TaxID=425511 RepID=UPI00105D35DE|nr:hypothetical protein [Pedobacter duraquae]
MQLEGGVKLNNHSLSSIPTSHYFLNDPINGDQIRQKGDRNILGFESVINKKYSLGNADLMLQGGVGLRYDDVTSIELLHTANRSTTIDVLMLGNANARPFCYCLSSGI